MTKFTRLAGIATTLAGMLLAGGIAAVPAQAAVTALYGLNYQSNTPLYSVNPGTAATAAIGGGITGLNVAYGGAWNPDTSMITTQSFNYGTNKCEIFSIDPSNGNGSKVGEFSGFAIRECFGLAYGPDKNIYISVRRNVIDGGQMQLVAIDPATFAFKFTAWDDATTGENSGSVNFITTDFSRGLIYFQTDDFNNLFSYNPRTHTSVNLSASNVDLTPYYGVAVGDAGELYVSTWGGLVTFASWETFPRTVQSTIGSTSGNMAAIFTVVPAYPPYDAGGSSSSEVESQSVTFAAGSSVLTGSAKAKIWDFICRLSNAGDITKINVRALVGGGVSKSLATTRARSIVAFLRGRDIHAKFSTTVSGRGVSLDSNNQRAVISVTYSPIS